MCIIIITHTAAGGPAIPISLANKAQYLLISRASAEDLRRTVAQQQQDTQVTSTEHLNVSVITCMIYTPIISNKGPAEKILPYIEN